MAGQCLTLLKLVKIVGAEMHSTVLRVCDLLEAAVTGQRLQSIEDRPLHSRRYVFPTVEDENFGQQASVRNINLENEDSYRSSCSVNPSQAVYLQNLGERQSIHITHLGEENKPEDYIDAQKMECFQTSGRTMLESSNMSFPTSDFDPFMSKSHILVESEENISKNDMQSSADATYDVESHHKAQEENVSLPKSLVPLDRFREESTNFRRFGFEGKESDENGQSSINESVSSFKDGLENPVILEGSQTDTDDKQEIVKSITPTECIESNQIKMLSGSIREDYVEGSVASERSTISNYDKQKIETNSAEDDFRIEALPGHSSRDLLEDFGTLEGSKTNIHDKQEFQKRITVSQYAGSNMERKLLEKESLKVPFIQSLGHAALIDLVKILQEIPNRLNQTNDFTSPVQSLARFLSCTHIKNIDDLKNIFADVANFAYSKKEFLIVERIQNKWSEFCEACSRYQYDEFGNVYENIMPTQDCTVTNDTEKTNLEEANLFNKRTGSYCTSEIEQKKSESLTNEGSNVGETMGQSMSSNLDLSNLGNNSASEYELLEQNEGNLKQKLSEGKEVSIAHDGNRPESCGTSKSRKKKNKKKKRKGTVTFKSTLVNKNESTSTSSKVQRNIETQSPVSSTNKSITELEASKLDSEVSILCEDESSLTSSEMQSQILLENASAIEIEAPLLKTDEKVASSNIADGDGTVVREETTGTDQAEEPGTSDETSYQVKALKFKLIEEKVQKLRKYFPETHLLGGYEYFLIQDEDLVSESETPIQIVENKFSFNVPTSTSSNIQANRKAYSGALLSDASATELETSELDSETSIVVKDATSPASNEVQLHKKIRKNDSKIAKKSNEETSSREESSLVLVSNEELVSKSEKAEPNKSNSASTEPKRLEYDEEVRKLPKAEKIFSKQSNEKVISKAGKSNYASAETRQKMYAEVKKELPKNDKIISKQSIEKFTQTEKQIFKKTRGTIYTNKESHLITTSNETITPKCEAKILHPTINENVEDKKLVSKELKESACQSEEVVRTKPNKEISKQLPKKSHEKMKPENKNLKISNKNASTKPKRLVHEEIKEIPESEKSISKQINEKVTSKAGLSNNASFETRQKMHDEVKKEHPQVEKINSTQSTDQFTQTEKQISEKTCGATCTNKESYLITTSNEAINPKYEVKKLLPTVNENIEEKKLVTKELKENACQYEEVVRTKPNEEISKQLSKKSNEEIKPENKNIKISNKNATSKSDKPIPQSSTQPEVNLKIKTDMIKVMEEETLMPLTPVRIPTIIITPSQGFNEKKQRSSNQSLLKVENENLYKTPKKETISQHKEDKLEKSKEVMLPENRILPEKYPETTSSRYRISTPKRNTETNTRNQTALEKPRISKTDTNPSRTPKRNAKTNTRDQTALEKSRISKTDTKKNLNIETTSKPIQSPSPKYTMPVDMKTPKTISPIQLSYAQVVSGLKPVIENLDLDQLEVDPRDKSEDIKISNKPAIENLNLDQLEIGSRDKSEDSKISNKPVIENLNLDQLEIGPCDKSEDVEISNKPVIENMDDLDQLEIGPCDKSEDIKNSNKPVIENLDLNQLEIDSCYKNEDIIISKLYADDFSDEEFPENLFTNEIIESMFRNSKRKSTIVTSAETKFLKCVFMCSNIEHNSLNMPSQQNRPHIHLMVNNSTDSQKIKKTRYVSMSTKMLYQGRISEKDPILEIRSKAISDGEDYSELFPKNHIKTNKTTDIACVLLEKGEKIIIKGKPVDYWNYFPRKPKYDDISCRLNILKHLFTQNITFLSCNGNADEALYEDESQGTDLLSTPNTEYRRRVQGIRITPLSSNSKKLSLLRKLKKICLPIFPETYHVPSTPSICTEVDKGIVSCLIKENNTSTDRRNKELDEFPSETSGQNKVEQSSSHHNTYLGSDENVTKSTVQPFTEDRPCSSSLGKVGTLVSSESIVQPLAEDGPCDDTETASSQSTSQPVPEDSCSGASEVDDATDFLFNAQKTGAYMEIANFSKLRLLEHCLTEPNGLLFKRLSPYFESKTPDLSIESASLAFKLVEGEEISLEDFNKTIKTMKSDKIFFLSLKVPVK